MKQKLLKKRENQNVIVITIQKLVQMNILSVVMKLAVFTSFGILGRFAFQWLPSVEPIIPLTIAIGFFLGYKYALPSGMSAFYISNFFVFGGHGPWTLFQVFGAGAAALTGDLLSRLSKSRFSYMLALILGTLCCEVIVDLTWFAVFGFISWEFAFLPAIPFAAVHVLSSMGFGTIIYGFKDKLSELNREDISYELKIFAHRHFCAVGDRRNSLSWRADNRFYRIRLWKNKRSIEYRKWQQKSNL
ncbi:MAG: hypothetical protein J7K72_03165 [Candidatus Aenigmarchaeota archaeon]|nr:hypothetical protein [Candidatus Aenigmarchaeota archaeon]